MKIDLQKKYHPSDNAQRRLFCWMTLLISLLWWFFCYVSPGPCRHCISRQNMANQIFKKNGSAKKTKTHLNRPTTKEIQRSENRPTQKKKWTHAVELPHAIAYFGQWHGGGESFSQSHVISSKKTPRDIKGDLQKMSTENKIDLQKKNISHELTLLNTPMPLPILGSFSEWVHVISSRIYLYS